jgi:predicted Fe-Mo cluster-binding NifX family protein
MIIVLPTKAGKLSPHFGQGCQYLFFEVDPSKRKILNRTAHQGPPHEPGLLPTWLAKMGVDVVIANGMGSHAQKIFGSHDIDVIDGAPCRPVEKLIHEYLAGTLETGDNICDH